MGRGRKRALGSDSVARIARRRGAGTAQGQEQRSVTHLHRSSQVFAMQCKANFSRGAVTHVMEWMERKRRIFGIYTGSCKP